MRVASIYTVSLFVFFQGKMGPLSIQWACLRTFERAGRNLDLAPGFTRIKDRYLLFHWIHTILLDTSQWLKCSDITDQSKHRYEQLTFDHLHAVTTCAFWLQRINVVSSDTCAGLPRDSCSLALTCSTGCVSQRQQLDYFLDVRDFSLVHWANACMYRRKPSSIDTIT